MTARENHLTKNFGKNLSVKLGIGNILGSKFVTQQFYKSQDPSTKTIYEENFIVQEYNLGRTYSLGITYQIR